MSARASLLTQLVLAIFAFAFSAVLYPSLPERVPTHWGLDGKPDAWGGAGSIFIMPMLMVGFMGLTLLLPRISPKNYKLDAFGKTYFLIMVLVSGLLSVVHVAIAYSTVTGQVMLDRVVIAAIFAFIAILGNLMGTVRRNFFVGIRTPWTLASERVWEATHRQAAWLWFFGGIVGALVSLLGVPMPATFAYLMILALAPVVQSYFIYRRLEGNKL